MSLNSLYQKVTNKVWIMGRKDADPNKGVAFRKHLVAAYQKLVKILRDLPK